MPDWLAPLARELPIVVAILVAVWTEARRVDRRQREELLRQEQSHAADRERATAVLTQLREDKQRIAADHRAELARMSEMYKREIARLQARITRLENKLSGEDE